MIYSKVYPFSNENLSSYRELYNFDGAKVVSVLGSGDQYFASKLYGSKEEVLFDNNATTIYHFILKFYSIRVLSYNEFINYFVKYRLNYTNSYVKVRKYLPNEVKNYFDNFYKIKKKFSDILLTRTIVNDKDLMSDRIIPYLSEENYYKLQNILNNSELPKMYISDLLEIKNKINSKYDIMLLSNIYMYLNINAKEYKEFLSNFKNILNNNAVIQANYSWDNRVCEFRENNYIINEVDGANLFTSKNSVLSLKI